MSKTNMKILGIGESVIDNIFFVGAKEQTEKRNIGGPVLTSMILLSRLGIDCTFLTSVGNDSEGEMIINTLKEEKIKTINNLQNNTKVNTILIDPISGQRKKIRGPVKHRAIEKMEKKFIEQFDFIIIDRHERKAFYEIVKNKKQSAKIIIDPSTEVTSFVKDMMRHADYPIIPIDSIANFCNKRDFSSCLNCLYKICGKAFVITLGELGSIIYDGENTDLIPARMVSVVDTTGAGDIYRGAFTYGIIKKWSLRDSAGFANSIAAMQCRRVGNVSAIPTGSEIKNYKRKLSRKKLLSVSKINSYFLKLGE